MCIRDRSMHTLQAGTINWMHQDRCDPKWVIELQGKLFDCADPALRSHNLEEASTLLQLSNILATLQIVIDNRIMTPDAVSQFKKSRNWKNLADFLDRISVVHYSKYEHPLPQRLKDHMKGGTVVIVYVRKNQSTEAVLLTGTLPSEFIANGYDSRGANIQIDLRKVLKALAIDFDTPNFEGMFGLQNENTLFAIFGSILCHHDVSDLIRSE
eukprot:TRINITY_DN12023_c0_g1_i7.p1 TRINITY_DN12023_c0_g1~~TRINITY_DN12023_c0_g1_i7.p1  ORF type:complete len:232 (+),score=30.12 TRINITY_DN12023_c0_g1_i7:62-697(+)